ncbi:MAG: TetR/AcrR family transcriptional regulator [PVC group bacterium]
MRDQTDTKQRLMDAALRLFTEKGFAGASTREIVEQSGVTKPTLYYYFPSKEELYRALIEENFERFNREIAAIAGEKKPPREKLIRVAEYNLKHCRNHPEQVKLTLMAFYRGDTFAPEVDVEEYGRASLEIVARIFREGVDAGIFRPLDPMKLSLHLMGVLHGQMLVILKGTKRIPLTRPEEIIETLIRGIGA